MNVSCDGNIVTVDGVKDFRLSQTACSGYMVHPWKTMKEYGVLIWIWTTITGSSRRVS